MHRNQPVIALILIIVVCFTSSCSAVEPDYQNDTSEVSEAVIEKQSIKEIWETWDAVLQESYDNVQLDTQIQLEMPEVVGAMTFVQRELTDIEQNRVFAEFVPDMKGKYYTYSEKVSPPGPEYDNPGTGEHLGVGTNGFVYYVKNDKDFFDKPRNYVTRNKTEKCAKAMMKVLLANRYYGERVCGIDACSVEIGCRPETFATEFRFLREIKVERNRIGIFWEQRVQDRRLWITYHVGEDFLDIADGLRAIDEAVMFLELERGDRLGHAIALGVEPEVHYSLKNKLIAMPKQDLLDNYVWLLFRSLELGVTIADNLRSRMQYEAQKLLYEIYLDDGKETYTYTLREYYESWKLRGDYPGLYQNGEFRDSNDVWKSRYESKKKESLDEADMLRQQKKISHLYYRYHFGRDEKMRGQEIKIVEATREYIDLMVDMQRSMRKRINEKGIAIECNPTSNVLIGTFKRYDLHPMFHFNNYALKNENNVKLSEQMNISINTDDLGVFDTSLENEFALIACALSKKVDENGNKIYSQDAIYDYLEHIRQMGLDQVFRT